MKEYEEPDVILVNCELCCNLLAGGSAETMNVINDDWDD